MSEGAPEFDLDPSYLAGLLDTVGRVRFALSEQSDGTYTVRPMLRIKPYDSEMREAVVGGFLESRGYQYDLIEKSRGDEFFSLQQRSDLEKLQEYLDGISAHLVRELEFVNGSFAEEFDFGILDPQDAYRFLIVRDELRYGWRPRGRYHTRPEDVVEKYGVAPEDVSIPSLPEGELRPDYSVEWIAGVFDGICRYRPSISKSPEHAVGFGMYPIARLYRSGVPSVFVDNVRRFFDDYDLTYGDSSSANELNVVFTGPDSIYGMLEVLFPRLLVLAEASAVLLDDILPRFDDEEERTKQGFYGLLRDFELVAEASGGPFKHREYTIEHFAGIWRDELRL